MSAQRADDQLGAVRDVRLAIPRRAQRFNGALWQSNGFDTVDDSDTWSDRACGVACVAMVLAYAGQAAVSTVALLHEGRDRGAYSEQGWVHAGLADLLTDHGVPAVARPVASVEEVAYLLASSGPVIASVTLHFPEDGSKGGHLVLVIGARWDGDKVADVTFNDPSRWGADHYEVSAARFGASFTGRIVATTIAPPSVGVGAGE